MLNRTLGLMAAALLLMSAPAVGADQTTIGTGNDGALVIAEKSPLIKSAMGFLTEQAEHIADPKLKHETLDAFTRPDTCIAHRANLTAKDKAAIVKALADAGLLNPADGREFPGGLKAGIFPAVRNDGTACPHLPQRFDSAPGSVFEGHHSYPGGLAMHEAFNDISSLSLAADYRMAYGHLGAAGLPTIDVSSDAGFARSGDDLAMNQDLIIAAPIWHDWGKVLVFQWNADGTEFQELNFGGSGASDNYGAKGDSRTPGHHILGLAESMKRGLGPELVITQASAHAAPTLGNEYKVVNWIRAAAIIARIDPVANGYLSWDGAHRLRLPALGATGTFDLHAAPTSPTAFLPEFTINNLSDGNYYLAVPAAFDLGVILEKLAPEFGMDPNDRTQFNNQFRNPVLSYLSAERLMFVYARQGLAGVRAQVRQLRSRHLI
ncbi:MAG: hypothetical protein JO121_30750 [Deltaproteobacteria bacterium]|nr:hypothetical protein [Deltaproteobacteria bacterium]